MRVLDVCHIIASYALKTILWKIICARAVLCRVCSLVNWTLLCSDRAAGHIWVQIVELYSPLHWLPALGLGWFDANMFGCLCICSTFINQIASLFLFTITLDFFLSLKDHTTLNITEPAYGFEDTNFPVFIFLHHVRLKVTGACGLVSISGLPVLSGYEGLRGNLFTSTIV